MMGRASDGRRVEDSTRAVQQLMGAGPEIRQRRQKSIFSISFKWSEQEKLAGGKP